MKQERHNAVSLNFYPQASEEAIRAGLRQQIIGTSYKTPLISGKGPEYDPYLEILKRGML